MGAHPVGFMKHNMEPWAEEDSIQLDENFIRWGGSTPLKTKKERCLQKGLLLWSLTARFPLINAGAKITYFPLGPACFSGAMLNFGRVLFFLGLFKKFQ